MPCILMGGFRAELADWLARRLGDVRVENAAAGHEVLAALNRGDISLLVLDGGISEPPALQILEELQALRRDLPVICCLSGGPDSDLIQKLVKELQVREVLLAPLDREELERHATRLLGLPFGPSRAVAEQQIQTAMADIRSRFLSAIVERLEVLERAGVALLEENLSPELGEKAEREAHKLAGLLGTLGFASGSRFAREIEKLLQTGFCLSQAQALRFSELVVALRLDVERAPAAASAQPESSEKRFSLLILDRDQELVERLEAEGSSRGLCVQTVGNVASAHEAISGHPPDVVLLDLLFSGKEDEGLALLEGLGRRTPAIPALVLTSKDRFTDRVEVARRGGRGFLSKSCSAAQIIEAATKLVERLHAADPRIMAVDDDPQVLALLRTLLEAQNASVATVADPLRFWDTFEAFSPDLLVLDIDMPHLSGIELCRVVRNDARRAETPVIFLTAYNDAETIHRIFTAGADDFVSKPIMGTELLTRIFNRLERVRLQRNFSEIDPLTGILNRHKSSQMLADFLDLARRHRQPLALAILRVEHLKRINDEYGYPAGDLVLQQTARILQDAFRSEDVFARWSGDEFVVGMYGLSRYDGVQRLSELLARLGNETFKTPGGGEFRVALNAGVAQYDDDGKDLPSLYKSAAEALAQIKAAAGGKVVPAGWAAGRSETAKQVDVTLVMRDEAQASLLLHALGAHGYRARWLQDGKAAGKLLTGPHPALCSKVVLMDVDLAGLDGLSLLKRMAWDGVLRETRVIMLSTPSVANEAQIALEQGAFDYVAKPLNPPVVVQHIRRALDGALE